MSLSLVDPVAPELAHPDGDGPPTELFELSDRSGVAHYIATELRLPERRVAPGHGAAATRAAPRDRRRLTSIRVPPASPGRPSGDQGRTRRLSARPR